MGGGGGVRGWGGPSLLLAVCVYIAVMDTRTCKTTRIKVAESWQFYSTLYRLVMCYDCFFFVSLY